jgi:hypothetical protein
MRSLFYHPSPSEKETRKRIKIAVAAYAYEVHNNPIMSDDEYDRLAKSIDTMVPTSRPDLDDWFMNNYHAHTGMWIWQHPELQQIGELYARHYFNSAR